MPRLSGGIPPDTIYYHMRRVDARHATRHDSEATGRYAAYAPTRKRLNTPTTAHSSSTTRHARENHPVHAADGLASAKCVLGGVGARKAARSAYSESAASSASDTSVSAVASATAAPSTDAADSPTSPALYARTLSGRHAHAPHLQLAPQHTHTQHANKRQTSTRVDTRGVSVIH